MRSIQTKFVTLVLACVMLSCIVTGGLGLLTAQRAIQQDSAQIMNLLCEEKAGELESMLVRVEQSAELVEADIQLNLKETDRLTPDSPEAKHMENATVNAVVAIEEVMTVRLWFTEEYAPGYQGLVWGRTNDDPRNRDLSGENLTRWKEVPWQTVEEPIWLQPKEYGAKGEWTVEYLRPLFRDGQRIGAIGMDVDVATMEETLKSTGVYQSGYAFLTDGMGNFVYHAWLPFGTEINSADPEVAHSITTEMRDHGSSVDSLYRYVWQGEKRAMAYRTMRNGMQLAVTAPLREINRSWDKLLIRTVIGTLCIMAVFLLITVHLARQITRPLKDLGAAARQIAAGDFSVDISPQTQDEVGALAESFQTTVVQLRKYIGDLSGRANRDGLTGVRNKAAYLEAAESMEAKVMTSNPKFAIIMVDLNYLKETNNTYGHDYGDQLIVNCCRLICEVFKHSPVFRFGGDEFVVLLENTDWENREELIREFDEGVKERNLDVDPRLKLSVAVGMAVYDPERDESFAHVFKRADELMYENKKAVKENDPWRKL